jgi:hypothetical protein
MRRSVGIVLLTLGFFSLSLAPLLRFYAAPKLIVAPINQHVVLTLTAENGSYLNLSEGKRVDAPLVSTVTLLGVKKPSTSSTAVWDYFSSLEDSTRSYSVATNGWRMAMDRKTVELKSCCTVHVEGNSGVPQSGFGLLFPLGGDIKKTTYKRFDPVTARTWPAVYQGEETVSGIKAYKFTERIDPSVVDTLPVVPGALVGLPEGNYSANKMYSADITLWVDPRTGLVIDQRQQVSADLQTTDGTGKGNVLSADLRMNDKTRASQMKKSNDAASTIQLLRMTGPLGFLVLGAVLLAAGAVLFRKRGQHRTSVVPAETTVTEPA